MQQNKFKEAVFRPTMVIVIVSLALLLKTCGGEITDLLTDSDTIVAVHGSLIAGLLALWVGVLTVRQIRAQMEAEHQRHLRATHNRLRQIITQYRTYVRGIHIQYEMAKDVLNRPKHFPDIYILDSVSQMYFFKDIPALLKGEDVSDIPSEFLGEVQMLRNYAAAVYKATSSLRTTPFSDVLQTTRLEIERVYADVDWHYEMGKAMLERMYERYPYLK